MTLNTAEIPKFSQNFLISPQIFKKGTLRGFAFATLPGTHESKKYSVPIFFPITLHGLWKWLEAINSSKSDKEIKNVMHRNRLFHFKK